jgi:hypothetical protein
MGSSDPFGDEGEVGKPETLAGTSRARTTIGDR